MNVSVEKGRHKFWASQWEPRFRHPCKIKYDFAFFTYLNHCSLQVFNMFDYIYLYECVFDWTSLLQIVRQVFISWRVASMLTDFVMVKALTCRRSGGGCLKANGWSMLTRLFQRLERRVMARHHYLDDRTLSKEILPNSAQFFPFNRITDAVFVSRCTHLYKKKLNKIIGRGGEGRSCCKSRV